MLRFHSSALGAVLTGLCLPLAAEVLHDWQFADPAGTTLSAAHNRARAFVRWDGNLTDSTTTGDGLLRIRRSGEPTSRRFDINPPPATDALFLVVEIDRWNLVATADSLPEISFDLINAPSAERSAQVTAGIRLALDAESRVTLQAVAGGLAAPGGQSSKIVPMFPAAMGRKLQLVVAYSYTRNQYAVFLRADSGKWFEFFRGSTSGIRSAQSVRLRVGGDFAGRRRGFFDIERITVATSFPGDAPIADSSLWRDGAHNVLDTFMFDAWQGPPIRVFFHQPAGLAADAPVMIVMHGVNRDADNYLRQWMPLADRLKFLLIVPEFSLENFPGDDGYIMGGFDPRQPQSAHVLAFDAIEPLFDSVRGRFGNSSEGYYLYGHSAGSQFVHRLTYFLAQSRVLRAVAANAGWYTLPRLDIDFPYGLKGTPIDQQRLNAALQRPLLILLGTADTDPNHRFLRNTPETLAQGPHRLARGHYFFKEAAPPSAAGSVKFGWQVQEVPGVAHSNARMAVATAAWLFGEAAGDGPPEMDSGD
jgi:poly(3-hydroxybutyrate) depolymerase